MLADLVTFGKQNMNPKLWSDNLQQKFAIYQSCNLNIFLLVYVHGSEKISLIFYHEHKVT